MSATPQEIELKFEINSADVQRLKRHLARTSRKKESGETLVSVYFDTADQTLRHHGVSLRVRRAEKNRYTQTIKSADPRKHGLLERGEWEHPVKGPEPDLAAANGVLEDLLDGEFPEPLEAVFETRVRRTKYGMGSRSQRIEVALDQGAIETGKRRAPICEVELELKQGERGSLFDLAKQLSEIAPLDLSLKAKADRGYELAGDETDHVEKAGEVVLSPQMTAQEAFRLIAIECLRQMLANRPAVIAGEVEGVHQMRIALRRLRAAMSSFSDVIADRDLRRIKSELRWITGELGPARDLDVFVSDVLAPLRDQSSKKPGVSGLVRDFERRRARARKETVASVRSARFRKLVLNTAEWIDCGPWIQEDDELLRLRREQNVLVHAGEELARRRRKLRRKGKSLKKLSPYKRHRARIAGKKLRYAVEFFSSLFLKKSQKKRAEDMLAGLEDLQGALGSLNDIAVRQRMAEKVALAKASAKAAPRSRSRAFAAGMIVGAEETHVADLLEQAEAAHAKLDKIKAFWK
jgi:triphosphatase